ncbi:Uncharacterised protein [Mycobacterium tuberculosis]|uniref:Uncharacterized protein n=1 Tax=Mycobacterium tuberculosis TaxID=1773 RepID=A0A655ASS9_MYCTX|nr:Uncharacterised protein [Mycobacterium tuberculosis]CKU80372.1 Uncharacterised protein [Mycobacterium tuberculosis]CPC70215.1 Uncharacterised protein [Mycobacterium tuberculosis]
MHTDTRISSGLPLPANASPRMTTAAVPGSKPAKVAQAKDRIRTPEAPAA